MPKGFRDVDRSDPLITEIESYTAKKKQFFFAGDILQMKIIFCSKRSSAIFGLPPELIDPSVIFTSTHPDDLKQHHLARTKLISQGNELYINKSGRKFMSTNFRVKLPDGIYANTLHQGYFIYTTEPYETVFYLQVITDISWFTKIKHGYHYYIGEDPAFFRYPDEKLLMTGNAFSDREFEIIELISLGLKSEEIARRLFLSVHTINTHRRNILKKTSKQNTMELILDLKAKGVL